MNRARIVKVRPEARNAIERLSASLGITHVAAVDLMTRGWDRLTPEQRQLAIQAVGVERLVAAHIVAGRIRKPATLAVRSPAASTNELATAVQGARS